MNSPIVQEVRDAGVDATPGCGSPSSEVSSQPPTLRALRESLLPTGLDANDPGYLVGQQGAPRVTGVTGRGDLLSGGVTELQVTWEDTPERPADKIVVRAPGYSGYYVFPAPADTHTATLRIHLPPVPEACPGGVCAKQKTPAMNLVDGLHRWLLNSSTMDLEIESAENLDTGSPVRTTPGAGVKDKIPEFVVAAIVWDLLDGTGDDPIAGARGSTSSALFNYLPTRSTAKLASRGVNGVDLVDYLDAWRCAAGTGASLDTDIGQVLAAVGGFPYDFAPVPGVCQ